MKHKYMLYGEKMESFFYVTAGAHVVTTVLSKVEVFVVGEENEF
jgi:hypothetical protein